MFAQLTILAPGLLGGSVAKAARSRGLARRIVVWARRPETRLRLRDQPWCNGQVSMTGGSYLGHTQWAVAPYVDPPLRSSVCCTGVDMPAALPFDGQIVPVSATPASPAEPLEGSELSGPPQ